MTKFIECFSYVHGRKEAKEMLNELNSLKSSKSFPFIFDSNKDDAWLILGTVTEEDWDRLNLDSDFMRI